MEGLNDLGRKSEARTRYRVRDSRHLLLLRSTRPEILRVEGSRLPHVQLQHQNTELIVGHYVACRGHLQPLTMRHDG